MPQSHLESWNESWDELEIVGRYNATALDSLPQAVFALNPGNPKDPMLVCNIRRICVDTVVKRIPAKPMPAPEALAYAFVRENTLIPTPRVRKCFAYQGEGYLALEYIPGRQLRLVWPALSDLQRFIIAWTLRLYINNLRAKSIAHPRSHIPGPLADVPQAIHGPAWLAFHRPIGPFHSYAQLSKHCNKWRPRNRTNFDDSKPLVLTHGDIHMHNIIVGNDGRLWVVDWGCAGFYPPWFEYIGISPAADATRAPKSWKDLVPLVTGVWETQNRWVKQLH